MICRSFSIASEVERDWPPSFSRLATPFSFYLAPLLSRRISSTTAHSTSLRTFEKLITTSLSLSLSAAYIISPHLFLACPRVYAGRLLLATMLEARTRLFHDVTMDVSTREMGARQRFSRVNAKYCEVSTRENLISFIKYLL